MRNFSSALITFLVAVSLLCSTALASSSRNNKPRLKSIFSMDNGPTQQERLPAAVRSRTLQSPNSLTFPKISGIGILGNRIIGKKDVFFTLFLVSMRKVFKLYWYYQFGLYLRPYMQNVPEYILPNQPVCFAELLLGVAFLSSTEAKIYEKGLIPKLALFAYKSETLITHICVDIFVYFWANGSGYGSSHLYMMLGSLILIFSYLDLALSKLGIK